MCGPWPSRLPGATSGSARRNPVTSKRSASTPQAGASTSTTVAGARSGMRRSSTACSNRVVAALRRARPPDTNRLLAYIGDEGWHVVHAEDVNDRFRELTGDSYSAKDLRTWNATVLAAAAFAAKERPASARGRKRAEVAVMREVAEELGNTPAVARRSYVDPRVVAANHAGQTVRPALIRAADDDTRDKLERAAVRLTEGRTVTPVSWTVHRSARRRAPPPAPRAPRRGRRPAAADAEARPGSRLPRG